MKVRAPMMSLDVRGRYGLAVVFSIWRGMNYLRALVVPTNPQSVRQVLVRSFLTAATQAWSSLTDEVRTAWDEFAELHPKTDIFGASFTPSGINYFVATQCLRQDCGDVIFTSAPTEAFPAVPADVAADVASTPGSLIITWSDSGAPINSFLDIWLAGPKTAGRALYSTQYRHHSYTTVLTETKTIDLVNGAVYGYRARLVGPQGMPGPFVGGLVTIGVPA